MLSIVWYDLQQVLPAIADMLAAESQLIVLVKPQFEAGKSQACMLDAPSASPVAFSSILSQFKA